MNWFSEHLYIELNKGEIIALAELVTLILKCKQ